MKCSIIIPHLNQNEFLKQCLDALTRQTINSKNFEVCVVDNGSKINPKRMIEGFGYKYYVEAFTKNPYVCRNRGVEQTKHGTLCFLDSKCIPRENWLKHGLEKLAQCDIVAGRYIIESSKDISENIFPLMYLNNNRNISKDLGVSTGNLFVRRSVFESLGKFNTNTISGNDILFTNLARTTGYKIGYADKAIVQYPKKPYNQLKRDAIKYGKGAYQTCQLSIINIWRFLLPYKYSTLKERLADSVERPQNFAEVVRFWYLSWKIKLCFFIGWLIGALNRFKTPEHETSKKFINHK